jgi:hypothetical protein
MIFLYMENLRLFVAVGNTELSNKMASYTTDQKVFIKTIYFSGGPCVVLKRQYIWHFSVRVAHPETLFIRLLNSLKKR